MPIRFRCPNCERMLQIARRKAGTEVLCPRCTEEVMVPAAEDDEAEADLADGTGLMEEAITSEKQARAVVFDKPTFRDASLPESSLRVDDDIPEVPIDDGVRLSRGTVVLLGILTFGLISLAFATGLLMSR